MSNLDLSKSSPPPASAKKALSFVNSQESEHQSNVIDKDPLSIEALHTSANLEVSNDLPTQPVPDEYEDEADALALLAEYENEDNGRTKKRKVNESDLIKSDTIVMGNDGKNEEEKREENSIVVEKREKSSEEVFIEQASIINRTIQNVVRDAKDFFSRELMSAAETLLMEGRKKSKKAKKEEKEENEEENEREKEFEIACLRAEKERLEITVKNVRNQLWQEQTKRQKIEFDLENSDKLSRILALKNGEMSKRLSEIRELIQSNLELFMSNPELLSELKSKIIDISLPESQKEEEEEEKEKEKEEEEEDEEKKETKKIKIV